MRGRLIRVQTKASQPVPLASFCQPARRKPVFHRHFDGTGSQAAAFFVSAKPPVPPTPDPAACNSGPKASCRIGSVDLAAGLVPPVIPALARLRTLMMLGYIHSAERGVPNAILSDLADRLTRKGQRVTGLIQVRPPADGAHPCDMDLHCLPAGPTFPVAQKLGAGSRGCRMDLDALETGVAYVETQIETAPDVFILNKFGAQEAQGRGFCAAIARAIADGIPVVTVVNPLNLDAFRDFAGDWAYELPPDTDAILTWLDGVIRPHDASAGPGAADQSHS